MVTLVYNHDYRTEDEEHYSMLAKIEKWFGDNCEDNETYTTRFPCNETFIAKFKKEYGEQLDLDNGRTEMPYLGCMYGHGILVWDTQREVYELGDNGERLDWSRTWYDLIIEFPTDEDAVLFKLTL